MTQINVRTNVKEVTKGLNKIQRKQIPFATSVALNKTGVLVLVGLQRTAAKTFEGGATPSTLRALKPPKGLKGKRHNIIFSTKKDLRTTIFLPDWAANYLKYQIDGGVRKTSGDGTGVPTKNKRLNKYGNIPGRKSGLKKGKKQFIANIKGIDGVWERYGSGGRSVRLLIAFESNPSYRKKFSYFETATTMAKVHFKRKLKLAINQALRTAR
tara:strand:+ start:118 stop:753 length:636 start_codon:yes stop_codon:yes gene_type:complete